jgi:hypothetical protein
MAKAAFDKNKAIFTSKLDLNFRKKPVNCYIWNIALYGAETHSLQKLAHKCLGSFEVWCWRRMKKISWTEHVNNEEVLRRVKEVRNILHTGKGGTIFVLLDNFDHNDKTFCRLSTKNVQIFLCD